MDVETFVRKTFSITDPDLLARVLPLVQVRQFRKKEALIKQGDTMTHLYLLVEGICRGCYSNTDGKEFTDCFVAWPGFPLAPSSDLTAPAAVTVEALTRVTVLSLALSDLSDLLETSPAICQIYQDFLLWSSQMHWDLKRISYGCCAQERYEWFLENYPGLIDRVCHRHIASFLNMSPVTLSRAIHGKPAKRAKPR